MNMSPSLTSESSILCSFFYSFFLSLFMRIAFSSKFERIKETETYVDGLSQNPRCRIHGDYENQGKVEHNDRQVYHWKVQGKKLGNRKRGINSREREKKGNESMK